MDSKKVMVTGGAGFIGSHLALTLAEKNHCTVIDDLSTGRIQNIAQAISDHRLEFLQGTVTDLQFLQRSFERVDYVFHQAAMVSVPRSMERPVDFALINIIGTLNVLVAAKQNRVRKVIVASSSSVYGETPDLPRNEQVKPSPQSPYAVSKLAGEHYCDVFSRSFSLPTVCLRYFNVYGPRQNPSSQYAAVIPKFIRRVLDSEPPIIFGDGNQTRDFTFVRDVVDANILAAESDATGVFNIGTGKRISINDLAVIIMGLAGSRLTPVYEAERSGDIRHSLADISKASAIGYRPKYFLQDGIKETLKYISNADEQRFSR